MHPCLSLLYTIAIRLSSGLSGSFLVGGDRKIGCTGHDDHRKNVQILQVDHREICRKKVSRLFTSEMAHWVE